MPATSSITPLLLAGPTAVGKSEIALQLALRLGGEIVSADSMQVYRGMDIGTAKPSVEDRQRVPHHLVDIVDIEQSFDAARFVVLAQEAIREIESRGRVPIVAGGTGLYFKALSAGLGNAPPADAALRKELEQVPLPKLLAELQQHDPVLFDKIDKQNPRRVIRAVEVIRLTGQPFSALRTSWEESGCRSASFILARSNSDLAARIDARVDAMFRGGLVEETRALLDRGLANNATALQALGYRQVAEHLRGERSLDDTLALVKLRTRQYAKRQMTWFRRYLKAERIDLKAKDNPTVVAELIARSYRVATER